MNQFNLGNFLNRLNYSLLSPGGRPPNMPIPNAPANGGFQLTNQVLNQAMFQKTMSQAGVLNTFSSSMLNEIKMNNLASLERSLYVKDLMNLPKELEEVLVFIQNNSATTEEAANVLTKNISLSMLSELIQAGGKEAMNKLVLVMANASRQGITDVSQIKDTIKFINASVAVAAQDNPNQIIKTFMLLYLPWLPLQEGVDFDLEVESHEDEESDSETSITIMISTKNYGNIKVTLILTKGSSIEIFINCSEKFPKEELLKRIKEESKNHSIQSNVTFELKEMKKTEIFTPQAKVSISNLKEVNPFLLVMTNAVIRHTIDLDNQG